MKKLKSFFLFCSGVDRRTLDRVPTEENKYLGIGGTILFTGIMAFLSAGYAMYTVFDSYWLAAGFGAVWGLMIFNLDRYIVASMKRDRGFFRNLLVALPRLGMAVLLAVVIAKPLELKIFGKEIDAELVVMEQEIFQEQEQQLRGRYADRLAAYTGELKVLRETLTQKETARDAAAAAALAEADGSGGSGIRNMGPIYRAKRERADAAQAELEAAQLALLPQVADKERRLAELRQTIDQEIAALNREEYGGIAARIAALDRLSQSNQAVALAVLFVTLLFIAIETAPIFTKLIAPMGPYDHVMAEYEHEFAVAAEDSITERGNRLKNRIRYLTEVGVYQTTADIAEKKAEIDAHLRERREKLGQQDFGLG